MALNLNNLRSPGVYIDEINSFPPSVIGVDTGIPAFIGLTQNPLRDKAGTVVMKPQRLTSMLEFVETYGGPEPEDDGVSITIVDEVDKDGNVLDRTITANVDDAKRSKRILYYAMEMYFANQGGPCWVVAVGDYTKDITSDLLKAGLTAIANEDEPTILVMPEAVHLTLADYADVYKTALDQAAKLQDRFVVIDVLQNLAKPTDDFRQFRDASIGDNLKYGAAYYPYLDTTIDYSISGKEDNVGISHLKTSNGADAGKGSFDGGKIPMLRGARDGVLLYNRVLQTIKNVPLRMPPSAAVAGIYAQVDSVRGVWKAPANVSVGAIVGPSIKIDNSVQDFMNVDATGKSINAIRFITGRGTLVWGARTLDAGSLDWRYINVRRFFNFVEESVKKATYRFVFEPNDANTWVVVRAMIENFLTVQWRQGALMGSKPEQAFFVRCGLGQTMTALDILEGRLNVEIGMAAVRPAEFIILKFSHKLPEA